MIGVVQETEPVAAVATVPAMRSTLTDENGKQTLKVIIDLGWLTEGGVSWTFEDGKITILYPGTENGDQ